MNLRPDWYKSIRPPWPTRKVRRPKRWGVLEVTDECHECGRTSYRLVWPWTVTYDERLDWPLPYSGLHVETDFGEFTIGVQDDNGSDR